ncbi:hypothetical protein GBL_3643 [Geobacillus kaustophilus GBlys]|nr:hypothetical protein GBL_3643 [Geobacillus kaustophilus GBlys]
MIVQEERKKTWTIAITEIQNIILGDHIDINGNGMKKN